MLNKNTALIVAKGVRELRKRISVPSSILDESINIATWNIRAFGKSRRNEVSRHYIAEILSNFDLIAITELATNLRDLEKVMKILGPYWSAIYSDAAMDRGGNSERIGYLYDKRVIRFTGLAAEADPFRKKNRKTGEYVPEITWWRSPYMASFRAGKFDFIVLAAHIRWGDSESDREGSLLQLAKWVEKRRKSKHVVDKDIIVMGDFNIPQDSGPLFDAITSNGLQIPKQLTGKHGTNLAQDKRYDQILHYPRHTKNIVQGGVVEFHKGGYRKLYPEKQFPSLDHNKFTFQISDHLPLWIQLDVASDAESLDQSMQTQL